MNDRIPAGTKCVIKSVPEGSMLYADLRGTTLCLRYKDRPGIIALIGSALSSNGINIDNIAAPADHATREALTVIKTNQPVSDELLDKIAKEIDAISAFSLNL